MEKQIKAVIKDVIDFPKKGIVFKDVTPVFGNPVIFKKMINSLAKRYDGKKISAIVGVESRGFIIGAPLAYKLGIPFVPVRKPGKLPRETFKEEYALEYGTNTLEIHKDALKKGDKVIIVDDLLATGGTAEASAKLAQRCGAKVSEITFVVELDFLKGRDKLKGYKVFSIAHY